MEAFTYAENAEIGMPDIESELLLIRQRASRFTRTSSIVERIASVAASGIVVFILSSYFMVSDNKTVSRAVKKMIGPRLTERLSAIICWVAPLAIISAISSNCSLALWPTSLE